MPRPPLQSSGTQVWRVGSLNNLELAQAGHATHAVTTRVHSSFEIAVVERGAIRVGCGGTTQIASAGSLVVIPPGEVHTRARVTDDLQMRSFFPELESLVKASSWRSAGPPSFREPVIADGPLANQIAKLHRMLARPGSALARETAAMFAATALVARHAIARQSVQEPTGTAAHMVRRIRAYLHDRLGANVSLSELSAMVGTPPHALVHAFTLRVGMPPHAYHLQIRINRAKALLARGTAPSRVAADTGFVDQSHLTRHFRRHVGVTPGAYAAAVIG